VAAQEFPSKAPGTSFCSAARRAALDFSYSSTISENPLAQISNLRLKMEKMKAGLDFLVNY